MEKPMVFWWEKEKEEEFRMFIIHSFSEYLLSIYYVPTIVLGVWNISKNQMDRDPCHHGAYQRSCSASPQKQPPQSVLPSCQFCYPCSQLWPSCPRGSPLVLGGWDYRKQLQQGEMVYFPYISQAGLSLWADKFDLLAERMKKWMPKVRTNPRAQSSDGRPKEKDSGQTSVGVVHACICRKALWSVGNICYGIWNGE